MRTRTIGLTALLLGTALATVPALAQSYPTGRTANDGGQVTAQTGGQTTGSASNMQAKRQNGDLYAFGGQGQPPAPQSHYPVGRAANDGGMVSGSPGR
jgi:hypothetical protein